MTYTSTLTSKGQTTIPVALREMLGLKEGDELRFEKREGGMLVKREKSFEERLAELHAYAKKRREETGTKPIADYEEAMEGFWKTERGQKELRDVAGLE
jgi:AbrB family looped-hinge helix DNA binding protein